MRPRVLVTARAFWVSGTEAEAELDRSGVQAIRSSVAGPLSEESLIRELEGCAAVIGSSDPYGAAVFSARPELQIVARCGVGIDSVDLDAATAAGVLVTNTPGAMTEAVADYTFGLMLALARRIHEADRTMRAGGWGELRGTLVAGKTLGLLGAGRIGQAVARRAIGFGMRVLACDPALQETTLLMTPVSLDELLAESDFLSLHAPGTPQTLGIMNRERFSKMKRTAYLINTGRGALVNEADLVACLSDGTIAGAALDVFRTEPLPADDPLRSAPNLLLTPHNAFNASEATELMSLLSARSVIEALAGHRPAELCNPAVWESPRRRTAPGAL